jgi:hypothetical protein
MTSISELCACVEANDAHVKDVHILCRTNGEEGELFINVDIAAKYYEDSTFDDVDVCR